MKAAFSRVLQGYTQLSKRHRFVVAVLLFAVLGTLLILATRAASEYAAFESELGSRSGSVAVVADGSASGGSYVAFGGSGFTVSITEPSAGVEVSGTITLRANYSGNVQNVEFYSGESKIALATLDNGVASASFNTATVSNGSITIIARAWDSPAGQAFTQTIDSSPVTFTVQNESGGGSGVGAGNGGSTAPRQPVVNVRDFGAKGDGVNNDTGAIQAAIDSLTNGGTVYFPAGNYLRGGLEIGRPNVNLWTDTANAVLVGNNNPDDQLIFIANAPGSGIYGLALTSPFTNHQRLLPDGGGRYRIIIEESSDVTIRGNTITGAPLMAIASKHGSDRTKIENNLITDTGADGIHFAGTSSGHYVGNNTIINAGDDCIAVVSERSSGMVSDVRIENNRCTNWWARGYTVVGGDNVTLENNEVTSAVGAGIYIACESNPEWATLPSSNIKVLHNRISGAVRGSTSGHASGASLNGHASILVTNFDGGGTRCSDNSNILVANNTIDAQVMGNEYIRVEDERNRSINIIGNIINGDKHPITMSLSASNYNLKGNSYNGSPLTDQINNAGTIPPGY